MTHSPIASASPGTSSAPSASAPSGECCDDGRPNLLFISGFFPNNNAPSSGQKLVFEEIRKLRETYNVHLVTFVNELEQPFRERSTVEELVVSAKVFDLTRGRRIWSALRHPLLPFMASGRHTAAAYVRDLLQRTPIERIVIEFTQAASVVPAEDFDRVEFVAHDCAYQAYERRAKRGAWWKRWLYLFEHARLKRWEQQIVRQSKWVTVLNAKDERIFREDLDRNDITIRYPELPGYLHGVRRSPEKVRRGQIMFWGHMARNENADAVVWFAEEILPLVLEKHPQASFVIAGASPLPSVEKLAGDHVIVTGFIEDPTELFEQSEIAVAPMRYGGGIKIKTVETTLLGIDTVATDCGAEGVQQNGRLHVAEDVRSFAAAVNALLARSTVPTHEITSTQETVSSSLEVVTQQADKTEVSS